MAPALTTKQWALSHLIALGVLVLVVFSFWDVVGHGLEVSVLDVGQGDAILISTPDYKNILIDAGPGSQVIDPLGGAMGFFDKTIDLFVLTHPHRDHLGGILDVMQKYKIKRVMLTGAVSHDPFYESFLEEIKAQNVEIVMPSQERDIQVGQGVYLDVLYPLQGQSLLGQEAGNLNNTSIAIRVMRQTSDGLENLVMLSGDAEQEEELEILLSGQDLRGEVLKLGHHGSRTATSNPWLQAVGPREVIVSAGLDNTFGHPHPETLEKVKELDMWNTMEQGSLRLPFGLW
ncbi:MAG: MBL fold metallo-hydrolase [Candidatus Peregrinibacteria bacterium]